MSTPAERDARIQRARAELKKLDAVAAETREELSVRRSTVGSLLAWVVTPTPPTAELEALARKVEGQRRELKAQLAELEADRALDFSNSSDSTGGTHSPELAGLKRAEAAVRTLRTALERGTPLIGPWQTAHVTIEDFRASFPHLGVERLPPRDTADLRSALDTTLAELASTRELAEVGVQIAQAEIDANGGIDPRQVQRAVEALQVLVGSIDAGAFVHQAVHYGRHSRHNMRTATSAHTQQMAMLAHRCDEAMAPLRAHHPTLQQLAGLVSDATSPAVQHLVRSSAMECLRQLGSAPGTQPSDLEARGPSENPVPPAQAKRVEALVEHLSSAVDRGQSVDEAWKQAHLALEDLRALYPKLAVDRLPPLNTPDPRPQLLHILEQLRAL